jgi:hypothetical protein
MWRKKNPHILWWECKLVQPLWKNSIEAPQKTKNRTKNKKCDLAIPLLRIYLKECKSGYNKGTCTPMFIAALFIIAKLCSQDVPLPTNGLRKCGTYIQWNSIQPQRRIKLFHFQVNGWNWRTSS